MEVTRVRHAGFIEIRVGGRLDAYNASHLERELGEVIRGGDHKVRLDLDGVSYLSSAGISTLLSAFQTLKKLGGWLALATASATVRSVLELSGLSEMFAPVEGAAPAGESPSATLAGARLRLGDVAFTTYVAAAPGALRCSLVGDSGLLASGTLVAEAVRTVALPPDTVAVGLGAFGTSFADCRERFGEFLSVAGCATCLPAEGTQVADYVVARGALVPELQVAYAAVCSGELGPCFRFQGAEEPVATPLSVLVGHAFELAKARAIGVVMVAETAGLVGAALRRSPAALDRHSPFDFPAVREWLSFTPERAFARSLAVIAGVAVREPSPELEPFLRPLGAAPLPAGHFHAAALTFRALPRGALELSETVTTLFEEQHLLGILHLLSDDRPIVGIGESLVLRGALWVAPLVEISRGVAERRAEVTL